MEKCEPMGSFQAPLRTSCASPRLSIVKEMAALYFWGQVGILGRVLGVSCGGSRCLGILSSMEGAGCETGCLLLVMEGKGAGAETGNRGRSCQLDMDRSSAVD